MCAWIQPPSDGHATVRLRATFSYLSAKISIHADGCQAATDNERQGAWTLTATSIPDAIEEIDREEHATERGLPIRVCRCAKP
jgi:hypothetical protein